MGTVRRQVRIARSGRRRVGARRRSRDHLDSGSPASSTSTVDGTTRVITTASGIPMPEEIVTIDPIQRRFQYRITAPSSGTTSARSTCSTSATARASSSTATDADPRRWRSSSAAPTGNALDELRDQLESTADEGDDLMGRKILFVTTDQQRYDTLGLQRRHARAHAGGRRARGRRASATSGRIPQSVVCMPSRSTIAHRPAPEHARRVDERRAAAGRRAVGRGRAPRAGYRTALIGKAHFEPFLDPFGRFTENSLARTGEETLLEPWADGTVGPHRGFEHLEFATHGAAGTAALRRAGWRRTTPRRVGIFYPAIDGSLRGERRRRRRHRRTRR